MKQRGGACMNKVIALLMTAMLVHCLAGLAIAFTKVDAESNVKKGIAFVKANGKVNALAEFSNPKGQFVKGELYIYAMDLKGVVIAHGANAKLIGKKMYDLKDASGKLFIQDILKVPRSGGWAEYQWINPVSKKIDRKVVYVESIGDIVLICGVYK